MMPMMASGQGDSVALETLETLPPWLWPIGPILPVSLPLPRWHQKNQSLRLTSRDSDVSNVAKLKNILSTYDYKIFQNSESFHFPFSIMFPPAGFSPSFEPSKSLSASRRVRRVTKRPPSRTWPRVQRRKLSQMASVGSASGIFGQQELDIMGVHILWYTYNVYR